MAFVFLVIIGVAEWALIQYAKKHLWIIPTVIAFNIFICWILLNSVVLQSIVFPYAQSYIVNQVTRQLNEKYCQELTLLVKSCKNTISQYLIKDSHIIAHYRIILEEGRKFNRFCEFLEKYVPANLELIEDHTLKKTAGKKTSRWQISREFL